MRVLEQNLTYEVRYRRVQARRVIEEQRCDAPERWYFKHEMELMLERVGFRTVRITGDYTDEAARDNHHVLGFAAIK